MSRNVSGKEHLNTRKERTLLIQTAGGGMTDPETNKENGRTPVNGAMHSMQYACLSLGGELLG